MAQNPRQDKILSLLQNLRQVSVTELTERLGVSNVTIRKDLSQLEEYGLILRSHGSARLVQDVRSIPSVSSRLEARSEEKDHIAAKAAELIREGDSVCIDAGSTNLFLARKIYNFQINVITNNLEIMKVLADSRDVSLTTLGGKFRQEGGSFIGPLTEDALGQLQFDIAFIGARAFTADGEFLTQNTFEGRSKQIMLKAAKRKVILADSSKLNASGFSKFAKADLVDVLITDSAFSMVEEFQELGIEVITV